MKVKVTYFGMLAEKIGFSNEMIELAEGETIILKNYFEAKHVVLNELNFKIAVNQVLCEEIKVDGLISEIALLPPFAGG